MRLLVLVGPTATGKTALAARLAHTLGVDVLSADSRQVYRGLDLGTGKDLEEFRRYQPPIRHHLIDIADPGEVYSLFRYQEDCYRTLAELSREEGPRGRAAILVGGTGLYLEAVLRRYRIANVPEDPALREALMARDQADLAEDLRRLDPGQADRTDMTSKKRIVRALEVAEWGRRRPVEYSRPPEEPLDFQTFCLDVGRPALRDRIDRRLASRLEAGMVEEVAGLLAQGVPPNRLKALGMEYREIAACLLGEKSRERMVEDLRHEIHLLAKRQETWFRGMERRGVPMRHLTGTLEEMAAAVLAAWKETE